MSRLSLRQLGFALSLGLVALLPHLHAAERARVTILSTTDLHGHINPIDYYTNQPANDGLAKLATLIKQARQQTPDLLLLDCGDTIQGTPLAYYHNRVNNTPVDPMMKVMSALKYDSMTMGNHEYNFGLTVLEKAHREASFPWLSANTYRKGTDESPYEPYVIKEVNGVRVGIFGLTTPSIPTWENPENYAGLEFRDSVSEARKWVKILREKEHVDLVIGSFHMGLEDDPLAPPTAPGQPPAENAGYAIARAVPEIDLIFMGHTHRDTPALVVNGVLFAQAGRWGDRLVRADIELAREGGGTWKVIAKGTRSLPVTSSVAPDPEVLALAEPYHAETQTWLGRPIGTSAIALTARQGSLQDSAILDLIHRVQLDAGQADVSMAANFNPRASIPAGAVTVRDIAGLYIYENTLVVLEVTGAQLRAALELSTHFFLPYQAGKSAEQLIDPAIPSYNFDVAEGVSYEIDLRRPSGERIQNLTFKGAPLADTQKLKLATNNYRHNGGGGYTMFKDAPVLWRSSEEIRNLVIAWVEQHQNIPTEPTHNWRILP